MAWVLEDDAPSFANVQGGAGSTARGRWVLDDTPEPRGLNWLEGVVDQLGAGFKHRTKAEGVRTARQVDQPLAGAVQRGLTAGLPGGEILARMLPDPLAGRGGTAERAATADMRAYDQANPRLPGFGNAVAYGIGEAPETLAMGIPGRAVGMARLGRGAVEGFIQTLYGGNANERDVGAADAALGAGAGVVGGGIAGVGAKLARAIAGKGVDDATREIVQLAADNGVKLRTTDLRPTGLLAQAAKTGRYIFGSGTEADLKAQADAIAAMSQRVRDQHFVPPGSDVERALLSENPETLIARSAQDRLASVEGTARGMFNAVPAEATIDPNAFRGAVQELATQFPEAINSTTLPNPVRERLAQLLARQEPTPDDLAIANALGGVQAMTPERLAVLEPQMPGITARFGREPVPMDPISAAEAHWIQSSLGAAERIAREAAEQRPRAAFLGRAREAVQGSFDETTDAQARAARDYFRQNVVPYREEPLLRQLVDGGATAGEGVLNKVGPDRPLSAELLARNLTPDGLRVLQAAMFDRAANKGINPGLASGISTPNIAKGFNVGEELGQNRAAAAVMTPEQQAAIDELRRVTMAARDAGTWAHNPATGVRNTPLLAVQHAIGRGGGGAGAGGAALGGLLGGPLGALVGAVAPSIGAQAVRAIDNSAALRQFIMANPNSLADPIVRAMLTQAAVADQPVDYSVLDLLGQ